MKKTGRYETALHSLIPGYVALAPIDAAARRALKVKAADVENVYVTRGDLVAIAIVRLSDGEILSETEPRPFGACSHGRVGKVEGYFYNPAVDRYSYRQGREGCLDCGTLTKPSEFFTVDRPTLAA